MFTERITNWKQIIAGFAGFGFLLSFVVGLFGGVVFGIILLRAFIFAVVFGGISVLIMVLIDSFIPELIDSDTADDGDEYLESAEILEDEGTASAEGDNIRGGNLDITIEDEDPVEPFGSDSTYKKSDAGEESAASELVEELEEIEAADVSESVGTDRSTASGDESDNSVLPDIGDFAESFTAANTAGMNDGLSSIDGMAGTSSAEIMGDMHDTEDIVKAVQTVLKKDQEG